MRRKSERTKEKEKSSPEKKSEKVPRRSRRQSRRRKRSVSTSPERDGSGTEENETSLRSSQEDTEEEQTASLEETSCQVGAVITADLASTSEVEENQPVSTRSRRSSKKRTSESAVSVDDERTSVTVKPDSSQDDEWKEDKTFWEETESKGEASEPKLKENEGRSPVWKVKCTDGGGGEIQKLKLCIVRPQEPTEPGGRKRKRLSRSSVSQQREKSDADDNESSKGSQGEEEKLSSDEKHPSDVCDENPTEQVKVKSEPDETQEEEAEQINVSGSDVHEVEPECSVKVETESCNTETAGDNMKEGTTETDEKGEEQSSDVVSDSKNSTEVLECKHEPSDVDAVPVQDEHEMVSPEQDENVMHAPKTDSPKEEVTSDTEKESEAINLCAGNPSSELQMDSEHISEKVETEERDDAIKEEDTNEETVELKENSSAVDNEAVESSTAELSCSDAVPESDDVSDRNEVHVSESDTQNSGEENKNVFSGKSEDHLEITSSDVPDVEIAPNNDAVNAEKEVSTTINSEEAAQDLSEDKAVAEPEDNCPKEHNTSSPKEVFDEVFTKNAVAATAAVAAVVVNDVPKPQEGSGTSEDEKELRRERNEDSSPRFRERHVDRIRNKEKERSPDEHRSPDERRSRRSEGSSKRRGHLERKSRSPQRREKISLRRSFSGKSGDLDQNKTVDDTPTKGEKNDTKEIDKILQENKENDAGKPLGETGTIAGIPRKRRWGQSNSSRPSKKPVLSISTDSLKTLIPGAKPVPIGEVQLVQDEEVKKEKEVWENEKDVEKEKLKIDVKEDTVLEKKGPVILPDASRISVAVTDDHQSKIVTRKISIVSDDARTLQRSPSPPRHKATNVLFITNLVRPFTVNQLKELLARTGKIIEGGFWIDKIKSKCYVEYEKESEAKETRHALHGVRWPVSNPKTLAVDFGKKEDMEMAQAVAESDQIPRKTEPLKVERSVDGWMVDQLREKEREREMRDREKEKERERERERVRGKERPHHPPPEVVEHSKKIVVREWDLGKIGQTSPAERDNRYEEKNREKERKVRKERTHRSRSPSPHEAPVRKVKKKEEDAPAKLLDDLFRKTKTTPCIYWLPLTAEQIVVKEEMRRKHMAEHERRMAEMRKAERERERARAQQRQQRRASERDKRRRRSGSGSPKK